MLLPSNSIVPAVGRISPEIVFSSVVLPAPLAPIKRDDLSSLDRQADVVQHLDLAVSGTQAMNREHAS